MPGDNIEVVCSLYNDLAADVGTRYVFTDFPLWLFCSLLLTLDSPSVRVARPVSLIVAHFVRTLANIHSFSRYRYRYQGP